ncbi:MAG TPA: phosphoglycerate dehydrogenase [Thermoleophilaceae bacterium]
MSSSAEGGAKAKVALTVSSFGAGGPEPLDELRSAGVEVVENPHGRRLKEEEVAEMVRDADGVIAGTEPLTEAVMRQAPRLRVISRVGVGMDSVDLAAAERLNIAVCNTPDAVTDAAAELAFGGMLCALRHLHEMDAELRAGRWTRMMGSLLRHKTVGIVGLGRVGRRVAALLAPFEPRLLGYDVAPVDDWASANGVELVELERLLAESDVVTLHVSKGPGSGPLLGRRELLETMKPGAVLVNAARGGLVDEEALAEALSSGQLAGAHLDVFENEPYDGPLREQPAVLLTPHAGSYAREARALMEHEAVRNLLDKLGASA